MKSFLMMCTLYFMHVMIDSLGGEGGELFSPWGRTGNVLYNGIEDKAPKSYYQCHPPDDLISFTVVVYLTVKFWSSLYIVCYHIACF